MYVPGYKEITGKTNGVLNRDFYHSNPLSLKLRTVAPNGVSFCVNGVSKQANEALNGALEARFSDKSSGLTLTQGWLTSNVLNTRIEMSDAFTPGLNGAFNTSFLPQQGTKSANFSLTFKRPMLNANVVADMFKSAFTGNAVIGQNGFVLGTEFAYDIRKGQVTQHTMQMGYLTPQYTASIQASQNFQLYQTSVFHKVNEATELGARAIYSGVQSSLPSVSLEAAIKHILDSSSFVKGKLNNQGVLALSFNQKLNKSMTVGVGLETNIQKINESTHNVGLSLDFVA